MRSVAGRFCLLVLILIFPTMGAASISNATPLMRRISSAESPRGIWRTPARKSQFIDVARSSSVVSRCEDTQPPEALATPNPLLMSAENGSRVKVSFIVGTDGRVHSPLILESAGPIGDRNVLRTVRYWRYRPATCNGVPTETEGKVEFFSH